MTVQISHLTVRENPPPGGRQVVGRMWNPMAEFKTHVPDYAPNFVHDDDDDDETEAVEAKVIGPRRGRRPRPKATEAAETK